MVRRFLASLAAAVVILATAGVAAAAPIKLARHPDYHARQDRLQLSRRHLDRERGRHRRASRHRPHRRATSIRASRPTASGSRSRRTATATTTCSSIPGGGRRAEAADVPQRQRRSRRLDARFGKSVIFRAARGVGAFPNVATLHTIAVDGGRSSRCRSTGATRAASRPTASRSSSTAIRRPGRASTIAAATRPISGSPTSPTRPTRKLLADERYNRYWPMWGADDAIYFVADPLPNEKNVKPGSPEVRTSVNNIYKIPVKGGPAGAGHEARRRQPVLAVDVERRQDHRLRRQLRHLEARRRDRPDERDQDRHRHRRQGERDRVP